MAKKKKSYSEKCLEDGFEVVFLMHDQLSNVIASDGDNASPEDIKYRDKAASFIKWYQEFLNTLTP